MHSYQHPNRSSSFPAMWPIYCTTRAPSPHYHATMQALLLLLPLLVLGARAGPCYTELYSGMGQTGNYFYLDGVGLAELSTAGMDDDIESVRQTGMWLYHENNDHNVYVPGSVYYVHGIDIAATFPAEYQNIMSSLRRAGCSETLNDDAIMFYEDTVFSGIFHQATNDDTLGGIRNTTSSIIVSGPSPWTVYTGERYTGSSWCLYNTDHDVGSNGTTLDLGIFPFLEDIGIPDDSIQSVRKGCHAARVAKAPKLQVDGRQQNGAWGRLL